MNIQNIKTTGTGYISKTGRKNDINLVLTIPSKAFFTHDDLKAVNPSFKKDITLRTRFKKELESGKVKNIGTLNKLKGRPKNVYSVPPILSSTIESAKAATIILHSEYLTSKITDISSTSHQSQTKVDESNTRKEYAKSLIFSAH